MPAQDLIDRLASTTFNFSSLSKDASADTKTQLDLEIHKFKHLRTNYQNYNKNLSLLEAIRAEGEIEDEEVGMYMNLN
jgi:hypothetical protein